MTLDKFKEYSEVNISKDKIDDSGEIFDFKNEEENVNDKERQNQIQIESNGDLNKVTKRQADLFELVDDIKDLNSIFSDLAMIIHSQGDYIETIDDHVIKSFLNEKKFQMIFLSFILIFIDRKSCYSSKRR
jgi:uncharacterized protein YeeX (DUF496 family)